jgi:site-specific recombinase XerD
VRAALQARHYSKRTARAYLAWIRRFILFHGKRHPNDMGGEEISAFLSDLASVGKVSSSTQNQALAALLFLYQQVLGRELEWLGDLVHAKRPKQIPIVLGREEAHDLLGKLQGPVWLVCALLYGGGLRLLEALRLRVKDIDLDRREVTIRRGKGAKDRRTVNGVGNGFFLLPVLTLTRILAKFVGITKTVTTSAPSKNCLAIATSAPP